MKVLLIDDHPLILSALQTVIHSLGDGVTVTMADSGEAAHARLRADPCQDLALLDLQLGDVDGFELLAVVRANYPAMPVVVISASDRTSDVIRAIDMGAMGFVPKRASNESLLDALQQVLSGGVYVPPMSMGADFRPMLTQAAPTRGSTPLSAASDASIKLPYRQLGLTPRQNDVLQLLLKGQPNKLIARELGLSVETVKDHVAAVLRALSVNTRTQAVIAVSEILQRRSSDAGWGLRRSA